MRLRALALAAAVVVAVTGCTPPGQTGPTASSRSTSRPSSVSPSPEPSQSPSDEPTEATTAPVPVIPPQSQWSDVQLAAMISAVNVNGSHPAMSDEQNIRWLLGSSQASPSECQVLLRGLLDSGARGLPISIGTLGQVGNQYTIVLAGTDEATKARYLNDRGLALKRCTKVTTTEGDFGANNVQSIQWVAREISSKAKGDDVKALELTSGNTTQDIVTGSVGDILFRVSVISDQQGGGLDTEDIINQLVQQLQIAQGSAAPSTSGSGAPSTSGSATPSSSESGSASPGLPTASKSS